MKKRLSIILWVAALCLIGVIVSWQAVSKTAGNSFGTKEVNPSQFYPDKFFSSVEAKELPELCQQEFVAGITSHHDLASPLIGQFFRCLKEKNDPKTFIIIGPNHFLQGTRAILTARNNWQTQFGQLAIDLSKIDFLKQSGLIEIKDQAVANDQTVSYLTSYIKYFWPDATIVPLLMRFDYSQREAEQGINLLARIIDDDTFILGSIDFSHYLALELANQNDQVSEQIISSWQLEKVYRHGDDFYDSAPGLFTILSLLQEQGTANSYILNQANSFDFNHQPFNTTSYFSWLFN